MSQNENKFEVPKTVRDLPLEQFLAEAKKFAEHMSQDIDAVFANKPLIPSTRRN